MLVHRGLPLEEGDVHLSNGMQFTQQVGPTNGNNLIKQE
jgi:hypothetical protein